MRHSPRVKMPSFTGCAWSENGWLSMKIMFAVYSGHNKCYITPTFDWFVNTAPNNYQHQTPNDGRRAPQDVFTHIVFFRIYTNVHSCKNLIFQSCFRREFTRNGDQGDYNNELSFMVRACALRAKHKKLEPPSLEAFQSCFRVESHTEN